MRAHLNFRRAYHDAIAREIKQLEQWRAENSPQIVDLPGLQKRRAIRDLTDSQIADVARYTAERSVNSVIHRHNDERQLE